MTFRWSMPLMLVAGLLAGCAAPGPQEASDPAVPAGMARLYFYRELNPYDPLVWTAVSLNGEPVGDSAPGKVFYRDVAPGVYQIEVRSDQLYPHQFKTVAVKAGSVTFARVEPRPVWNASGWQAAGNTFVVAIIEPSIGWHQVEQIRRNGYVSG